MSKYLSRVVLLWWCDPPPRRWSADASSWHDDIDMLDDVDNEKNQYNKIHPETITEITCTRAVKIMTNEERSIGWMTMQWQRKRGSKRRQRGCGWIRQKGVFDMLLQLNDIQEQGINNKRHFFVRKPEVKGLNFPISFPLLRSASCVTLEGICTCNKFLETLFTKQRCKSRYFPIAEGSREG